MRPFERIREQYSGTPAAWRLALVLIAAAWSICGAAPATAVSDSALRHLYDYSYQSQGVNGQLSNQVSLRGHDTAVLSVDLKNEGVTTWERNGPIPVRLGTSRPQDLASPLATGSWLGAGRPTTFAGRVNGGQVTDAATIAPGETARFSFTIKAPNTSGTHRLYVQPVTEGLSWFKNEAGIFWDIQVTANSYQYQWLGQSGAVPDRPNATGTLAVAVKNTGNVTWTNTGDGNTIRLGTARASDRGSAITDSSWQSPARVGSFVGKARLGSDNQPLADQNGTLLGDASSTVAPGEAALFSFTVKTPARTQVGPEYFNFVVDGKAWLPDVGLFWPVNVSRGYDAQWVGQSETPTITKSNSALATIYFDYKNTGRWTWYKNDTVRLGTANPLDRASRFALTGTFGIPLELPSGALQWQSAARSGNFSGKVNGDSLDTNASAIAPGETGRFMVTMNAASVPPGTYREYFRPVADGFNWLRDYQAFQAITVQDTPAPPPATPTPPPPTPPSTGSTSPFAGKSFYVDPATPAKQQADQWRSSRPADAAQLDKIANRAHAEWFGGWSGDIASAVAGRAGTIRAAGALPVFVAYNIPQRDCGSYSAGGAGSPEAYRAWINGFANGLGNGPAAVVLEPDALSGMDCLSASDRAIRTSLLSEAVDVLRARTSVSVYLDAGHAGWHSAADMASRLNQAGVGNARGFSLNISNFGTMAAESAYGHDVSSRINGKPFVIDTGRNGLGGTPDNQWCNPDGRALGTPPTAQTNDAAIDAYFWIKAPGESDGTCNGGPSAGTWWTDYALGLAQRAAF